MSDINNTMKDIDAVHEECHKEFTPSVHKIGAGTMAVALLLSVLPTIYFVFIKLYFSNYLVNTLKQWLNF